MWISALVLHCWRRIQLSLTTPLVRPARDILYCPMKVSDTKFLFQSLSSSCAESGSATTNLKTSSHLGLRVEEATEVLCSEFSSETLTKGSGLPIISLLGRLRASTM